MISINLNTQIISIEENSSLLIVLEKFNSLKNNVAIAVNKKFIPRSQYSTFYLQQNDIIDVVSPMQGG